MTDRPELPPSKRLTPEERVTPLEPGGGPHTPPTPRPNRTDCDDDRPAGPPPLAPLGHRYAIRSPVGMGGMSLVLLGRDELLGRQVAVKVLRDDLYDRQAAERRFLREARIHAQLQHAGIAPLYDLGRFPDGRPCIVMKFLHGKTLDDLLQAAAARPGGRSGADFARFFDVFADICRTVAYAHGKGVIHRDLKPLNVMVTDAGQVQVLDWGLAKVTDEPGDPTADRVWADDQFRTAAGHALGTPAYAAPEQASGDLPAVDERSDVFGLGAILCEILTGDPPYRGEFYQAANAAASGAVGEAFARLDACYGPPELIDLAKRCLSPDPAGRPPHAAAVADAVAAYRAAMTDRALHLEAELKARAGGQRRRETAARRWRTLIALAASAALVGGLLFFVR